MTTQNSTECGAQYGKVRRSRVLSVPEQHQLKIARKSMQYICSFAGTIGLKHAVASEIIARATGRPCAMPDGCYCHEIA